MPESNVRFSYSDHVAIVTGAGQGIGRSIVLAFAEAGAMVVITDIDLKRAEVVRKEAEAKGVDALAVRVDVSVSQDITAMITRVQEAFGRIDVLVNNAGIANRGDIFTLKEDGWDRLMAVNLKGVWMCSRDVLKVMSGQKSGRVINVGSISGWLGGHEVGADYAASKAAVAVLTKRMANEMADKGITINSVAPHAIETPMTDDHGQEGKRRIIAKIPVGRFGKPEEVAAAVLFLSSREAGFITGQTIHVNGGTLMVY